MGMNECQVYQSQTPRLSNKFSDQNDLFFQNYYQP
uniref:Uncharacterized protein n=1 Tax=Arundo donax TaxID=35708 RepID=A0A0A9BNL9_ARUDO